MSFKSRMSAMLRRQEGVRRRRDRFVILAMVFLLVAAALVITQVRADDPQLTTQLILLPIGFGLLWFAWRCLRAAFSLTQLYNDPHRLSEMESLEELPGLSSTLLPFLNNASNR